MPLLCVAGALLMTIEGLAFYYYHNKTKKELNHMKTKRNDERSGRIAAQQKLRHAIAEENTLSGYRIDPIGHIEAPYNERRGTPRQPMLVPAAHVW